MGFAFIHFEAVKTGGKVKRIWAVALGFCLILGFQNCSQNGMQGSGSISSNDVSIQLNSSLSGGTDAVTSAKVTHLEVPNISDASQVSAKASEVTPYRLVVSVETGDIQLVDDSNTQLERRCLSADSLQELKTILNGASVCENSTSSQDICAMRYLPGYASLYANEARINLGESKDSCDTGKKDLCGALADVFQAYVANLKLHWSEMNCQ